MPFIAGSSLSKRMTLKSEFRRWPSAARKSSSTCKAWVVRPPLIRQVLSSFCFEYQLFSTVISSFVVKFSVFTALQQVMRNQHSAVHQIGARLLAVDRETDQQRTWFCKWAREVKKINDPEALFSGVTQQQSMLFETWFFSFFYLILD
jgi:hypothetical protein